RPATLPGVRAVRDSLLRRTAVADTFHTQRPASRQRWPSGECTLTTAWCGWCGETLEDSRPPRKYCNSACVYDALKDARARFAKREVATLRQLRANYWRRGL